MGDNRPLIKWCRLFCSTLLKSSEVGLTKCIFIIVNIISASLLSFYEIDAVIDCVLLSQVIYG